MKNCKLLIQYSCSRTCESVCNKFSSDSDIAHPENKLLQPQCYTELPISLFYFFELFIVVIFHDAVL